jgi:hypothetical protein
MKAALQQAKAQRDLAQVTWDRDNPLVQKGWVTRSRKPISTPRPSNCACSITWWRRSTA